MMPVRFRGDESKRYYEQRFGLMASGKRPRLRDVKSLIKYARQILDAEAEVVAQGHAPMSLPSAESLAEALNVCLASRSAVSSAMGQEDVAMGAMVPLRDEVDLFLRELRGRIRGASVGLSPQAIRNRQRIFGFQFVNNGQLVAQEEESAKRGGVVAQS